MTNAERSNLLASLGYRYLGKEQWAKPWGPSLLVVDLVNHEVKQVFYDINGVVKTWNSVRLATGPDDKTSAEDVGIEIMRFESNGTHAVDYWGKHFCFLTPEQRAEFLI